MRLLHLYWPHLLLELTRRRSDSFPPGPIVIGGRPWTAGLVLDADPAARELGVRRGMPLGSAHRLAPEATFVDPAPEADRAAVEAAFEALAAYSPGLAGTSDPADPAFGLLEVQVDGLEALWGPESVLVERIVAVLAPLLPGPPKAGIAGTRFAATIAAGQARPGGLVAISPGGEAAALAPLPAGLLTPDPDVRARLTRFGLRQVGAVAELARSALIARFGEEGARLHARARGEEISPFRPRRAVERLALALPIEPPVTELEAVRFVLRRLVNALAGQLQGRGMAATRARLRLELDLTFAPREISGRPIPPEVIAEQRFPEPTAEAEAIERLLFARLERTPPAAPIERLELELAGVEPAAGQQLQLFVPQAARNARLGWQLARLALTFGEDRIRTIELADPEASLPERRWRWRTIATGTTEETGTRVAGPR
jgi:nucleotidyltransferase/DNA polymerase involved in DNA repair